jgi:excinuclease ABC subunit C
VEGRLPALPAPLGRRHGRLRVDRGGDDAALSRGPQARSAARPARDRRRRRAARGRARGLEPLGLGELPIIGLAKERVERDATAREVARRPERLFLPNRKNPIVLRTNSSALFLLQRARDEAHRFANAYHRKLRDRARLRSPLDDVPGIGPSRRRELLRHFGSVKRLRAATMEELLAVPGISTEMATRIKENLR